MRVQNVRLPFEVLDKISKCWIIGCSFRRVRSEAELLPCVYEREKRRNEERGKA